MVVKDGLPPHLSQGPGTGCLGTFTVSLRQGPSVMLNAHPSLPMRLPSAAPIVLAHGSNDEATRCGERTRCGEETARARCRIRERGV